MSAAVPGCIPGSVLALDLKVQLGLKIINLAWTPFKSLALRAAEELRIGPHGAIDDRRFFLIDDAGRIVNGTRFGPLTTARANFDGDELSVVLADGSVVAAVPSRGADVRVDWELGYDVAAVEIDGPWADPLGALVGRTVRVVEARPDRPAWSQHPISLLGVASARALGTEFADTRRFRMLIEFDAGAPFVEDTWLDREVALGDEVIIVLRVACARCAVTTRDPQSGIRDHDALRAMKELRGMTTMGMYADVLRPGAVRVGDAVVAR